MSLFTSVTVWLLFLPAPGHWTSAAPEPPSFEIPNGEPDDDQLNVFTKVFLSEMGKHHGDKNGNVLRAWVDPRYLKKHGLTDRDLSVQMAPIWGIRRYEVADDRRTILCLVETAANPKSIVKEAILIRVVVHERKLYLLPEKAPDPKTGSFTPWILRTKL